MLFRSICHETGHALYEQGLPKPWLNQLVGQIHSMAMHESQSLFMEMEVCQSKAFIQYLTPMLEFHFGKQLGFSPENIYRLITKVEPGFIRVDADEVTYPLHIILRYDLEKALFDGSLKIKDLPDAWDNLMTQYLGLSTKDNYRNGVMQDVHWPSGAFGYFPSYTLGRLIAAQLADTFQRTHPDNDALISQGNFDVLHQWLRSNVYDYAFSMETDSWLKKITDKSLSTSIFVTRINERYMAD